MQGGLRRDRVCRVESRTALSSFRHGGFTECGDTNLIDTEIRALSRRRTAVHMPTYVGATQLQLLHGIEKRRVDVPRPATMGPG